MFQSVYVDTKANEEINNVGVNVKTQTTVLQQPIKIVPK